MEGGGDCLKYLKSGWNRKEGSGNKDFKKGGTIPPTLMQPPPALIRPTNLLWFKLKSRVILPVQLLLTIKNQFLIL